MKRFRAIATNGILKPIEPVDLTENGQFEVFVRPIGDDIPADALAELARQGGGFDFLGDPREDIYGPENGEEV